MTLPNERRLPTSQADFFESYRTSGPGWNTEERQHAMACVSEAELMAARMRHHDPGYSLAFLGQTSSGKTMLAKLIRRFWNHKVSPKPGVSEIHFAHFINWPSHDWRDVDDERSSPCVIVDEVGRGERGKNGAEWTRFLDFFNFRQERSLWTVLTSNLTWDEIKAVDPAMASRLRRHNGVIMQAGSKVRPFEDRKP